MNKMQFSGLVAAALAFVGPLAGCSSVGLGIGIPIGGAGVIGVSVGSDGTVGGSVGVGTGGVSVGVGGTTRLPPRAPEAAASAASGTAP